MRCFGRHEVRGIEPSGCIKPPRRRGIEWKGVVLASPLRRARTRGPLFRMLPFSQSVEILLSSPSSRYFRRTSGPQTRVRGPVDDRPVGPPGGVQQPARAHSVALSLSLSRVLSRSLVFISSVRLSLPLSPSPPIPRIHSHLIFSVSLWLCGEPPFYPSTIAPNANPHPSRVSQPSRGDAGGPPW